MGVSISPQGAEIFEEAVKVTIWQSGKEYNTIMMKEVITELEKFNIGRTALITVVTTLFNLNLGESIEDVFVDKFSALSNNDNCLIIK